MKDERRSANIHRSSFTVHRFDETYDAFAYAYDAALGQRFFKAVRRLLDRTLKRHPVEKTHLDVACGTGLAIEHLQREGFRSTGVDLSMPMLEVAGRRADRLIAGDVAMLPLRSRFGLVTCLYDSLNHLRDIRSAFVEVRRCMNAGSLFVFDMNDPKIYPVIWGMAEPFVAEGRDYHLEIATKFDRRTRIARGLVRGWAMVKGRRVKIEERHRQYAHSRKDIDAALTRAGIEPIEVVDFDPFGEARRVKLFYVCRAFHKDR